MMMIFLVTFLVPSSAFLSGTHVQRKNTYLFTPSSSIVPCPSYPFQQQQQQQSLLRSSSSMESEEVGEILESFGRAFDVQTPHSGRHFLPATTATAASSSSRRRRRRPWHRRFLPSVSSPDVTRRKRFFEGWYYRLTLPNASFALIVSIDDPNRPTSGNKNTHKRVAIQIMGPNDEYIIRSSQNEHIFWAWRDRQALGATFSTFSKEEDLVGALDPVLWNETVQCGFQTLPTYWQGRIRGHDGNCGNGEDILDNPQSSSSSSSSSLPIYECNWDFQVKPLTGWGNNNNNQKNNKRNDQQQSTAGWLASYAVFEPHWQITMSDGRATGTIQWKNQTFTFVDAPFYAEKNWGGTFPSKWYWAQCNAFDGYMDEDNGPLTVTAGGGIRGLPLQQRTESLGMVCIHYKGIFYEAVPWTGDMEWDIDPWGKWIMKGRCTSSSSNNDGDGVLFEALLESRCDAPGVVLRAPTKDDGLAYFCRDSFLASITLSLWELVWDEPTKDYVRGRTIIDAAQSLQGGVEVGGGPWWDTWRGSSQMKQPFRAMVRWPYRIRNIQRRLFAKKN